MILTTRGWVEVVEARDLLRFDRPPHLVVMADGRHYFVTNVALVNEPSTETSVRIQGTRLQAYDAPFRQSPSTRRGRASRPIRAAITVAIGDLIPVVRDIQGAS